MNMNIPMNAAINELPNPIPEGKKVITCARCEGKFLVDADAPYTADSMCEACAAAPVSTGSTDAAATVAAALGK